MSAHIVAIDAGEVELMGNSNAAAATAFLRPATGGRARHADG